MTKTEQPVIIACIFTWIGFVCAISFLEAWLKFRAPGVTLGIGLGIGRLVFNALNKIEWIFAIAVLASAIWNELRILSLQSILLAFLLIILLLQTFWLLPQLDARAQLHISGQEVKPSNLHLLFIIAEFFKTISLITYVIKLFKRSA